MSADATLRLLMELGGEPDKVKAAAKDVNEEVDKMPSGTEKAAGGWGTFKTAAVSAGLVIAGVALQVGRKIIDLGAEMVDLGANAEETFGKFEIVFGDSTGMAVDSIDEMASRMGRSRFAMRDWASSLQDTFVPLGFARDEAADMSLALTELVVDTASFNNSLEEDVIRDFQSAIVGNHETMRKYGVIITAASLDQELMNQGIEGGIKEATEAEKVNARLAIITDGLGDAIGNAEDTSHSYTNQMKALNAVTTDAKTEIGLGLLPVLIPFIEFMRELANTVLPPLVDILANKFAPVMAELAEIIVALAQGDLEAVFRPEVAAQIRDIAEQAGELWTKFNDLIEPIKEITAEFFSNERTAKALAVVLGILVVGSLITLGIALLMVLAPIALIIAAVMLLQVAWDTALTLMAKGTELWGVFTTAVFELATTTIDNIMSGFVGDTIRAVIGMMERLVELWGIGWQAIVDGFLVVKGWIQGHIQDFIDILLPLWYFLLDSFVAYWSEKWETISSEVLRIAAIIEEYVTNFLSAIEEIIRERLDIISAFWTAAWLQVVTALSEKLAEAKETIITFVLEALGIVEDADWVGSGEGIVQGIIDGIKAIGSQISSTLMGYVDGALESAKSRLSDWVGGITGGGNGDGDDGGSDSGFSPSAASGATTNISSSSQTVTLINPQFSTSGSADNLLDDLRRI